MIKNVLEFFVFLKDFSMKSNSDFGVVTNKNRKHCLRKVCYSYYV